MIQSVFLFQFETINREDSLVNEYWREGLQC